LSYQLEKPKTAREAIRYFHAITLDYIAELKKQFPNHDISVYPSTLAYHPPTQLVVEARVWDRTLHIEFEVFPQPRRDEMFNAHLAGKGKIHQHRVFDCLLYILPHGKDEWRYWLGHERSGILDADFLLEQMRPLLVQARD